MPVISAYHRPDTLDDALVLLSRPGVSTAVLAGGAYLNAHMSPEVQEVVDLQAVGLDGIEIEGERLAVGAMVRLQALLDHPQVPLHLREAAHREAPNTFRHAATVGGVVAGADWESEFLAMLLAFEATVTIQQSDGASTLDLAEFLAHPQTALGRGLLVSLAVATTGQAASARVGRTPADKPIVAAIGRRTPQGAIRLALAGVAASPVLIVPERVDALQPPSDFRGSSEYRRQMALVLSQRVLAELGSH